MNRVICVTNRHLVEEDFLLHMGRVVEQENAPDAIILREKDLPEEEYEKLARQMVKICGGKVLLILHYYPSVATRLGVKRIHLPLDRLEEMTEQDKEKFDVIGVSTHSVEQARRASQLGATYITAGHVFLTDCKKGVPARGIDFLKEVCKSVEIPVYAIGGMNRKRVEECIKAGASGGCIMSGFMS